MEIAHGRISGEFRALKTHLCLNHNSDKHQGKQVFKQCDEYSPVLFYCHEYFINLYRFISMPSTRNDLFPSGKHPSKPFAKPRDSFHADFSHSSVSYIPGSRRRIMEGSPNSYPVSFIWSGRIAQKTWCRNA